MAFIVYPAALSRMPWPNLWSMLFFVLLLFLGLDSAFTTFETMYSSLCDAFPILGKKMWLTKLMICVLSMAVGLPLITEGGHYMYQIIDWYQAAFLMAIAFVEVMAVSYIYGTDRLKRDIRLMTGVQMTKLWDVVWRFILPAILLILTVMTPLQYGAPSFGDYEFPQAAISFGWFVATCGILPVPMLAIFLLVKYYVAGCRSSTEGASNKESNTFCAKLILPQADYETHRQKETLKTPMILQRMSAKQLLQLNKQCDSEATKIDLTTDYLPSVEYHELELKS